MYKALIFDFDSTLVDYHAGDGQAIEALLSLLPQKIDSKVFTDTSVQVLWDLYDGRRRLDGNLHEARFRYTFEHFRIDWDDRYLQVWLEVYLKTVPVYAGVRDLFERLHRQVPLALLTNAIDTVEQRQRIRVSGLEPFFKVVGIAQEIGWYKPKPEAFYWVAQQLGVRPEECIFIGDSEAHDIEGALAAGMYAIRKIKPAADQPASWLVNEQKAMNATFPVDQAGASTGKSKPDLSTAAHASFSHYHELPRLLQGLLDDKLVTLLAGKLVSQVPGN